MFLFNNKCVYSLQLITVTVLQFYLNVDNNMSYNRARVGVQCIAQDNANITPPLSGHWHTALYSFAAHQLSPWPYRLAEVAEQNNVAVTV